MTRTIRLASLALLLACGACAPDAPQAPADTTASAAPDCAPMLESAWIRSAPPGTAMHAGYAVMRNDCDRPVTVVGAESLDFASASIHETMVAQGMTHMQEAGPIVVAAHGRLVLAPGGRHLMLMRPARELPEGTRARARLVLADGRHVFSEFEVRRDPPR
jgi:copper(I)-binding protein